MCALLPRLRDSREAVPSLAELSLGLSPLWRIRAAWLLGALNLDRLQVPQAKTCVEALEACLGEHTLELHPLDLGRIQNLEGRLATLRGDLEHAQAHFQSAVLHFATVHAGREMAYALANAGNLRSRLGRPRAALDAYTRALELLPVVQLPGNKSLMGLMLNLGVLCYKQGDTRRAHRAASLASAPPLLRHATGALRLSLDHLLSVLNTELGDYQTASDDLDRAALQAEALGSLQTQDSLVLQRAWLSQAEGEMREAQAWLQTPPRLPRAPLPELSWQVCDSIVQASLVPSPAAIQRLEAWRGPCQTDLPPSAAGHLERALHRLQGLPAPLAPPPKWTPEASHALERMDALLEGIHLQVAGLQAARIGRDLNNTLTAIKSELWMLREDHPDVDLELLTRSTDRLEVLGDALLSRERSTREDAQDLSQCVRAHLPLYRRLLGQEITLKATTCVAPLPVSLDSAEVHKVLLNLLTNARESIAPNPGQVQIVLDRTPEHAWLHVDDTGSGIPAPMRSQVLKPGFSTRAETGRGLGLSVVEEIVRKRGGRLVISESASGGARVGVKLPLSPKAPAAP